MFDEKSKCNEKISSCDFFQQPWFRYFDSILYWFLNAYVKTPQLMHGVSKDPNYLKLIFDEFKFQLHDSDDGDFNLTA